MRNLTIKAASWLQTRKAQEEGQTAVEYALVVGLVSLVIAVALAGVANGWITSISGKVSTHISNIA